MKGLIVEPGGYGSDPQELRKWYMAHGFEQMNEGVDANSELGDGWALWIKQP